MNPYLTFFFFFGPVCNFRNATDYLKTLLHPINPILEDSAGDQDLPDLSLNKILEGKTRAIAARMFFEVLVSLNVCF